MPRLLFSNDAIDLFAMMIDRFDLAYLTYYLLRILLIAYIYLCDFSRHEYTLMITTVEARSLFLILRQIRTPNSVILASFYVSRVHALPAKANTARIPPHRRRQRNENGTPF
jgi:hypothetical protein